MMRRSRSWLATVILPAILIAGALGASLEGTAGPQETAASGPAQSASRRDPGARSRTNGVYAVLSEGPTGADVQSGAGRAIVLIYDRKYSDAEKRQPPLYVALDRSSFVPLVLSGAPIAERDDSGWTLLDVRLAQRHVKSLENFTQRHLGGKIAIVIAGEIITMHTVRNVIKDGRARITRCSDDACRTLLLKLTE